MVDFKPCSAYSIDENKIEQANPNVEQTDQITGPKGTSPSQPPLCPTHNKPIEAFCEKFQTLV